MRNQRSFSVELKRQVVEELMGGESGLPSSVGGITSPRACSIIGKDNTAGASSTTRLPSKGLSETE